MKAELCRDILNEENDSLIEQMKRYYERLINRFKSEASEPFIGPKDIDEAYRRLDESEIEIMNGDTMAHEEVIEEVRQRIENYAS